MCSKINVVGSATIGVCCDWLPWRGCDLGVPILKSKWTAFQGGFCDKRMVNWRTFEWKGANASPECCLHFAHTNLWLLVDREEDGEVVADASGLQPVAVLVAFVATTCEVARNDSDTERQSCGRRLWNGIRTTRELVADLSGRWLWLGFRIVAKFVDDAFVVPEDDEP